MFKWKSLSNLIKSFGVSLLFVPQLSAENNSIKIVTGLAKPPFILTSQKDGMQLDVVKEAFLTENIDVAFVPVPLGRNITELRKWDIAGILTIPDDFQYSGLHISKPYMTYQNVAISLVENDIEINNIEDLQGKSIVAFQKAKKFLGDNYNKAVSYSLDYREIAEQDKQISMLFAGRTEVIIADINIFKYKVKSQSDPMFHKTFKIHYIFPERKYSAGFKSKKVKETFDKGVQLLIDNGTYNTILDKYLSDNVR